MPESYAQVILHLVGKGVTPKEVIARVHDSLVKRKREALWPRIRSAYARLVERENRKNRSALIVARRGDEKAARKASGGEDATLVVDETVIGGWRLEEAEVLTDASFKKYLLSIYTNVLK